MVKPPKLSGDGGENMAHIAPVIPSTSWDCVLLASGRDGHRYEDPLAVGQAPCGVQLVGGGVGVGVGFGGVGCGAGAGPAANALTGASVAAPSEAAAARAMMVITEHGSLLWSGWRKYPVRHWHESGGANC